MGLLAACQDARKQGSTVGTQNQRDRNWNRWLRFLDTIECKDDPLLRQIPEPFHRTATLSAFSQSMRQAEFSSSAFRTLAQGTVRASVDHVAQTFRIRQRPDPRLDADGKLSCLLSQQYKGYKNTDKNSRQQKALPLIVVRQLVKNKSSKENIALA